jgi:hypothetical protein
MSPYYSKGAIVAVLREPGCFARVEESFEGTPESYHWITTPLRGYGSTLLVGKSAPPPRLNWLCCASQANCEKFYPELASAASSQHLTSPEKALDKPRKSAIMYFARYNSVSI